MAKRQSKQRRTKALAKAPVTKARASPKRHRVIRKARQVTQKANTLMTPAAGLSAAAASALGSALGARIVASGKLSPKQTGATLILAGGAATYAGYRTETPIAFGAGIGAGLSGISLLATNAVLERQERQQRRNALLLTTDGYFREIEDKEEEDEDHDLLH